MSHGDLPLPEVIARAYARAFSPAKLVKLVRTWLEARGIDGDDASNQLAEALLVQLPSRQTTPSLLLAYISTLLSASLLSSSHLITHLLFRLSLSSDSEPTRPQYLPALSALLLDSPSLPLALPPVLSISPPPPPSIGSSTPPPQAEPQSAPTFALLLPLIRQCALTSAPPPVLAFTARLLSLLPPYPAPPLDAGLEAGSLLQSLPEEVARPLRECLGGLMADLSTGQDVQMSDGTQALQASTDGSFQPAIVAAASTDSDRSIAIPPGAMSPLATSPIPLQHMIPFLLAHSYRLAAQTPWPDPATPPPHVLPLLRLAPHLAPPATSPAVFLEVLLYTALTAYSEQYTGATSSGTKRWLLLTEHLPKLIASWKDQSQESFPFPGSEEMIRVVTEVLVEKEGVRLRTVEEYIRGTYKALSDALDGDDEAGSFAEPEGWALTSLEVIFAQRLLELGVLDEQQTSSIVPGLTSPSTGESLLERLATAPPAHHAVLSHVIIHAPGAARTFAQEAINAIRACPATPPPENLFLALSASPTLITALTSITSPSTLISLLTTRLLDVPDDQAARQEDPQGSLTRFGEAVVLAEAVVDVLKMDLPPLMLEARRATGLADMDEQKKGLMNGWIKALFGSDGIDDDVLLATSPQDFYRLGPSLMQQAISATQAGIIDVDTLHSGLSYFSQPLLSWSLGGITAWLCTEIERNGLLSALHLNVLQNLILSDAFPQVFLRSIGPAVLALLEPSAGLAPVLASSGFDTSAVRAKLEALDIASLSAPAQQDPATQWRAQLQSLRQISIAPPTTWDPFFDALDACISSEGQRSALEILLGEVTQPLQDPTSIPSDPVGHLAAILLSLNVGTAEGLPLLAGFVGNTLPSLLGRHALVSSSDAGPANSATYTAAAVARLLKRSLLATADACPGSASMERPVASWLAALLVDTLAENASSSGKRDGMQAQVARAILQALRNDEELQIRFSFEVV